MLDAIGSMVVVYDMDDRIAHFNHACEQITGYQATDILGQTVYQSLLSTDQPHLGASHYRDQQDDDMPGDLNTDKYTNHWHTSDGSSRLITWSSMPLFNHQHKITHIIATGHDITELHLGEQQILINAEQQETMNSLLHIGMEKNSLDNKLRRCLQSLICASWVGRGAQAVIYSMDKSTKIFQLNVTVNVDALMRDALQSSACHITQPAIDTGHIQFLEDSAHLDVFGRPCYSIPIKFEHRVIAVIVLFLNQTHTQNLCEIVYLHTIANTFASIITKHTSEAELQQSQSNLAEAQRIAQLGSWEWNINTTTFQCSAETRRIIGADPDSMIDQNTFISSVHKSDKSSVIEAIQTVIRDGGTFNIQHRICSSEGNIRHVRLRGEAQSARKNLPDRIIGVIQDITDRVIAQQDTQLANNVFEGAQESIMVVDTNYRIIRVNKAFTTATGHAPDNIIDRYIDVLNSDQHDSTFYNEMWSEVETTGVWRGDVWIKRRDGSEFPEYRTITVVRNNTGNIERYLISSMDLSDIKESEQKIHQLVYYDALTQLPNKSMFQSVLVQAIEQAEAQSQILAVLSIDLDGLKRVNDSIGYGIGDRLLSVMADRLSQCVRSNDTVARWGSDEFVILLADIKQKENAISIANKILNHLIEPVLLDDHDRIVISGSIGISTYPADGTSDMTLIQCADVAMHKAKSDGGNRYHLFKAELNTAVIERLSIETGLRAALELEQFEIHYQALMDLQSRQITGAEALIRWNHPNKGLVAPDRFIPIAEDSGLIIPIGEWVLKQACTQCAQWQTQGIGHPTISINLSAKQFRDANLVQNVGDALQESGLDPDLLTLELTESSIMDNAKESIACLHLLKSLGVHLSIDDFGTGYSSLAYLKRFPIDKLKIDRSFIQEVDINTDDRSIVKSIIAMGHSLNLGIIAEGVEKVEHLNFLNLHDCEEAQGYYISKPIPADSFVSFIKQWHSNVSSRDDKALQNIHMINKNSSHNLN